MELGMNNEAAQLLLLVLVGALVVVLAVRTWVAASDAAMRSQAVVRAMERKVEIRARQLVQEIRERHAATRTAA